MTSYSLYTYNNLRQKGIIPEHTPYGDIGTPGGLGFGVGIYPSIDDLSDYNLTPAANAYRRGSDNYGNYIHSNGSIMVFIPKFYYRIGNVAAPAYPTFGDNTIEIRGVKDYENEVAANVDGFILHRAFIDGGLEKSGFFIDKYEASQSLSDSNIAVSVKNGIPISLTTTTTFTRSATMTGCVGQLLDAVKLSRDRGTGYNCSSIFMKSALAMLALCHAQNTTSSEFNEWYDETDVINFPKGNNNSALADVNDTSTMFTTAGDSGDANKARTGSGVNFKKTTHNGQTCGVADINGNMWEVNIGITQPGTTAGGSGTGVGNTIYVLKESVSFGSLTQGWDGATDAWGNTTHLNTLYDSVTAPISLSGLGGWISWGNGTTGVFHTDISGINRALCGVLPISDSATSAGGIDILGKDGIYRYVIENMCIRSGGDWSNGTLSGCFTSAWDIWRTTSSATTAFRSALYVS